MWSKEQAEAMCKILELQAQFKISDLDLIVYDAFKFMVNCTEEGMNVDLVDACDELAESAINNSQESEWHLKSIMKENWTNPEVFEHGI